LDHHDPPIWIWCRRRLVLLVDPDTPAPRGHKPVSGGPNRGAA
jgi:hypothetical protein